MESISNDIKETKKYPIYNFFLYIIAIALSILILAAILCPLASQVIADHVIFSTKNLTNEETKFLQDLIQNHKIYTGNFIFERIISFYEILITYLVGLLAVGGILGYFYVKKSYTSEIREEVFCSLTSNIFSDSTARQLEKIFSKEKEEGGELNKISNDIDSLTQRIDFLEKAINNKTDTIDFKNEEK